MSGFEFQTFHRQNKNFEKKNYKVDLGSSIIAQAIS